jgi:AraC-like DNA-binding protein
MYASLQDGTCELVTIPMRTLGRARRHLHVADSDSAPAIGGARIAAYWHLPEVLSEFGIDVRDVLFDDPENLIPYPDAGRLLATSARHTGCDHIGLLIGQRSRLADMGLAGDVALCAETAGEGLQHFADFFTLHNTAATVCLITSGDYSRLVYAIAEPAMRDTGQIQLGAVALAFNILQDLCGPEWLPAVVTVASSAPTNLRPCQKFFRAPLCFNSDETALAFESHWLGRPLPPVNPFKRHQVEAEMRAHQAAMLADFPRTVHRILRKQLIIGEFSMDAVATLLDMHRRTLDRRLKQHGMFYGDVLESVKHEVACQLLRDTDLQVQQVAEALRYSCAANFSTAFHRWAGVSPSDYRRQALTTRGAESPLRPAALRPA